MHRTHWLAGGAVTALVCLVAVARADLVFFKDGYVLQGKVRRQTSTEFDSVTGEFYSLPRGFYMVDDGPRRVYFCPQRMSLIERLSPPADEQFSVGKLTFLMGTRIPSPPPLEEVVDAPDFNEKTWERVFKFRSGEREIAVKQRLATVNPYYARVDATSKFRWSHGYLTREFDPEQLYALIKNNKFLDESPPRPPKKKLTPGQILFRRMKLINFCTQAGWYDKAEKELARLAKDMPEQKSRVELTLAAVARHRARDQWEEIKVAYQAGQYKAAAKLAEAYSTKHAPDKVIADLRELRSKLVGHGKAVSEADAALAETAKFASSADGKALALAATVIRKELHSSNIDRLDGFLGQYREANRQKARGKAPPYTADQLLALAVSGFLLGGPSGVPDPTQAISLWKARQLVLEAMNTATTAGRQALINAYLRQVKSPPDMDEVAQMVDYLPPFDPARDTSTATQEVPLGRRGLSKYLLKLPPEYTHNRSYPVVVALHDGGESAKAVVKRWEKMAAKHGYILVVPEWGGGTYRFTEDEHMKVLDALKDVRRRFHPDSDRVFLFGQGEGGKMAFDVGLSHPDLFAGVMPMGAGPLFFARKYWRNAQYLPFYIMTGTNVIPQYGVGMREQLKSWVNHRYSVLLVEYKGRGSEWLGGELPNMFDWMRFQKRVFPLNRLGSDGLGGGFGEEFCTHRDTDDRFYWISTEGLSRVCRMPPGRFNNLMEPAKISARVVPTTNTIICKGVGVNKMTVWIGRNSAGQYLLDLDRKVTVQVGLQTKFSGKVTPSLGVLLDDLHERADRKHLFVAKVPMTGRLGG